MPVEIVPVTNKYQLQGFLQLPQWLYSNEDSGKVLSFKALQNKFNPQSNPFMQHIAWQGFLAMRDEKPVGRIIASVDNHFPNKQTGFFGFLESINEGETTARLCTAAEEWLKAQGKKEIAGPISFTTNDNLGLLVEGHELSNPFYLSFNPPYYQGLLEQAGYSKLLDLFSYSWASNQPVPERLERISSRLKRTRDLQIRPINYRQLNKEAEAFLSIYNSSMVQNWGHTPLTLEEARYIIYLNRQQIRPDFFLFAEVKGLPAGICLAIPNPENKSLRLAVLGVRPDFNHLGLSAVLVLEMMQTALKSGLTSAELSYVQESNRAVNKLIQEDIGSTATKRYRIYRKKL